MRLDFKVLWIDDQQGGVRGVLDHLRDHVEEEGFRLEVFPVETLEHASALITDHVWADGIDLVLVDFDLGSGSGGELALGQIKRLMPYKEVVFYSSRATADLRKLAYDEGVEGVYCANRTSLAETITGVFDALVKKVLDINHCRGIILGATSDVDDVVNGILSTIAGSGNGEDQAYFLQMAMERIDEALKRFQLQRDQLADQASFEEILRNHQYFTSADRLRLLIALHDRKLQKTQPALRKAIGRYLDSIPRVRNMFGHARLTPGQQLPALRGFGEQRVDPETLREVRRELVKFRDTFHELASLLCPEDPVPGDQN